MDDNDTVTRRSKTVAPDISGWSIDELRAYIVQLQGEIERAKAEIDTKNSVRSAAEALFKAQK